MSFQLKDVFNCNRIRRLHCICCLDLHGVPAEPLLGGVRLSRALIEQFRTRDETGNREENLRDQVLLFKRRFELMRMAINVGLLAAILLMAARLLVVR